MRILFTRFPLESSHGGAEVQTIAVMRGLMERGHGVAFLGSCPTLLRLCDEHGILSGELPMGPPPVTKWNVISFLWRKKKMQERMLSAIAEFGGIDAICMLSLSEKLLLTAPLVAKGIKVFWIEHDGVGRWLTKNPWLLKLRSLATLATTIVVSDLSRDLYLKLGWPQERVVSIPNGIDGTRLTGALQHEVEEQNTRVREYESTRDPLPAPRSPLPASFLPPTPFHIGTLARLTQDKGIDVLLEAVTDLHDVSLTIVGSGREEGFLRKLIDERHLADRVTIMPYVDDLGAFYHSLDVFVLPSSSHDPFGLVAGEAMMMGVATVVTDVCGIARHIRPGIDAIVAEANNVLALKEAISALRVPSQRAAVAEAGKHAAEENFSLEKMVEAYEKVIRR